TEKVTSLPSATRRTSLSLPTCGVFAFLLLEPGLLLEPLDGAPISTLSPSKSKSNTSGAASCLAGVLGEAGDFFLVPDFGVADDFGAGREASPSTSSGSVEIPRLRASSW